MVRAQLVLPVALCVMVAVGCAGVVGGTPGADPSSPAPLEVVGVGAAVRPELRLVTRYGAGAPRSTARPQVLCLGPGKGALLASLAPVEQALRRDFTLELWVRTEVEDDQRIVSEPHGLELYLRNERLVARVAGRELAGGRLRSGTWHHVALVVIGSEARLYLDGVHQQREWLPEAWPRPAGVLAVGRHGDGAWFEGQVDDLRLVDRALYHQPVFDAPAVLEPVDGTLLGLRLDQELPGGLVPDDLGQLDVARLVGDAGLCAIER